MCAVNAVSVAAIAAGLPSEPVFSQTGLTTPPGLPTNWMNAWQYFRLSVAGIAGTAAVAAFFGVAIAATRAAGVTDGPATSTGSTICARSRHTRKDARSPAARRLLIVVKSAAWLIASPLMPSTTSIGLRPAAAAGLPGNTSTSNAPRGVSRPSPTARAGVTSVVRTPMRGFAPMAPAEADGVVGTEAAGRAGGVAVVGGATACSVGVHGTTVNFVLNPPNSLR